MEEVNPEPETLESMTDKFREKSKEINRILDKMIELSYK